MTLPRRGDERAVWAVWWDELQTRAPFVVPRPFSPQPARPQPAEVRGVIGVPRSPQEGREAWVANLVRSPVIGQLIADSTQPAQPQLEAEKAALLDVVKSIEAEFWFRCGDAQCKDDRCLMVDDLRNVIAKAWTRHDVGILTEAGRRENDRRRDAADAREVTPPASPPPAR